MRDAAARASWWGGARTTLLDSVNECYVDFMQGTALSDTDEDGRALFVYLQSLAPDTTAPALPFTVEKNVVSDPMQPGYIPSGDASRGMATYQSACAGCHGAIHSGAGRLGKSSLLPDDTNNTFSAGARGITVEKVRHGNFFASSGVMPLYSTESLSDGDLGDVLACLGY